MSELALYSYFRSSCSYRVRIALAIKGLEYDYRQVHLVKDGGEQRKLAYRQHNPQGLVPTLMEGQQAFTQSLAIIEYLEECHPEPHLLPSQAADRAYVRALAQLLACDIQPLNNLRVTTYLKKELGVEKQQIQNWYQHWIAEGFSAFESMLNNSSLAGSCCYGHTPTLADICLIPQVYNARRFNCSLEDTPRLKEIYEHCVALPEFVAAAPENQADAE